MLCAMKRRAMLSSLACAAVLAFPAASWASHLPGVLTVRSTGDKFEVRPAVIGYTGDGTGYVGGFGGQGRNHFGHMKWLTYTTQVATGSGALWGDNCEPDCARGTFSPVPVKVRAFAPRCGHFTRLTLRYERESEKFTDERGVKFYNSVVASLPGYYEYFIVREVHEYIGTG